MNFAVITTGGKQFFVKEGQVITVEKIESDAGSLLEFAPLLVANEDGSDVRVGNPTVTGATVTAKVVEHGRHNKVSVIKFKPKVRYRRNVGHRQPFTKLIIEKIS